MNKTLKTIAVAGLSFGLVVTPLAAQAVTPSQAISLASSITTSAGAADTAAALRAPSADTVHNAEDVNGTSNKILQGKGFVQSRNAVIKGHESDSPNGTQVVARDYDGREVGRGVVEDDQDYGFWQIDLDNYLRPNTATPLSITLEHDGAISPAAEFELTWLAGDLDPVDPEFAGGIYPGPSEGVPGEDGIDWKTLELTTSPDYEQGGGKHFEGKATPGSVVTVDVPGAREKLTAPVNGSGDWSVDSKTVYEGNYQVTLRQEISGHYLSTSYWMSVTPEVLSPEVSAGYTPGTDVAFSGVGLGGATLEVETLSGETVDSVDVPANGEWNWTLENAGSRASALSFRFVTSKGTEAERSTTIEGLQPKPRADQKRIAGPLALRDGERFGSVTLGGKLSSDLTAGQSRDDALAGGIRAILPEVDQTGHVVVGDGTQCLTVSVFDIIVRPCADGDERQLFSASKGAHGTVQLGYASLGSDLVVGYDTAQGAFVLSERDSATAVTQFVDSFEDSDEGPTFPSDPAGTTQFSAAYYASGDGLVIGGLANNRALVTATIDGKVVSSVRTGVHGVFGTPYAMILPAEYGGSTATVTSVTQSGRTTSVDVALPDTGAPAPVAPVDPVALTSTVAYDGAIGDAQVTGTATPGSLVRVTDVEGTVLAEARADGAGVYRSGITEPGSGFWTVHVTETDAPDGADGADGADDRSLDVLALFRI